MLTSPLIRQQRVVDVIVFLLLLASQWMRVSDIGGITGITKHFRLRFTKQQQHHEILLKCHCFYYQKKKKFLSRSSDYFTSGKVTHDHSCNGLEWGALKVGHGMLCCRISNLLMGRASVHSNASGRRLLFTTSLRTYLGPEILHPCCLAFLNSQVKSHRHHLKF